MDLKSFSHVMAIVGSPLFLCLSIGIRIFVSLEIKSYCEIALRRLLLRLVAVMFALQVGADHVYVFVGLCPSCSVSKLIGLLKCSSDS